MGADEDRIIIAGVAAGDTDQTIADRLGWGYFDTKNRIRRLRVAGALSDTRLNRNFWNADNIAQLKALYADGATYDQIAEAVKAKSRNTVASKINQLGLSRDAGAAPRRTYTARKLPPAERPVPLYRPECDGRAPEPLRDAGGALFNLLTIPFTRRCKWPHGEVGTEEFHLCGHDAPAGAPYCFYHMGRRKGAQLGPVGGLAFGNAEGRAWP